MSTPLLKIKSVDWANGSAEFTRPLAEGEKGVIELVRSFESKYPKLRLHVTLADGRRYTHTVRATFADMMGMSAYTPPTRPPRNCTNCASYKDNSAEGPCRAGGCLGAEGFPLWSAT